jgi:hypothetical protein
VGTATRRARGRGDRQGLRHVQVRLHPHLRNSRRRRRLADLAAARHRAAWLTAGARHHPGHPRRTQRRRAAPLPIPAGHRRPARRRRRLPAVLILAHPGTRHHRPGPGSRGTVRAAAGAGQPGRALRRGDGPVHPRAPGQLPASSHPRGARPSRARAPRYPAAGRWKGAA